MQRPECTFGRRVSENDKKKTASEIESKRKKRGPHLAQNFTCQSTHCGVAKTGKQGGIFFVLGPDSVWDQDEVSFRILLFVFFFFFFYFASLSASAASAGADIAACASGEKFAVR